MAGTEKLSWLLAPERRAVVLLLVLALVVRMGVGLAEHDLPLLGDSVDYDRHARSISEGHGYPPSNVAPAGGPTALRPPAWPYALGAEYALSGGHVGGARLVAAVIGTVVVALLGLVAFQLFGRLPALATIGLAAVYPPLVLLDLPLFSEPFFLVLMLGAIALVLEHRRYPRGQWLPALAGVALGLAVLTRVNAALLVIPLVLMVASGSWRSRKAWAPAAVLVVCALLTIAPWTIRNASVMHAFIPVTTQTGYTLAGTYNNTARFDKKFPAAWRPANLDPRYYDLIYRGDRHEVAVNRRLGAAARRYIQDRPFYVIAVAYWNIRRFLHVDGQGFAKLNMNAWGLGPRAIDLCVVSFWLLALLAIVGFDTGAWLTAPRAMWLIPALLASVVFIEAGIRFRLPIDVFLILLASLGVAEGLRRLAARRAPPPAAHM